MKKVVLDTSIIIDHFQGKDKTLIKLLQLQKEKKAELIVPSVVIFEFYSGLSLEKKSIFRKTELYLLNSKSLESTKKLLN